MVVYQTSQRLAAQIVRHFGWGQRQDVGAASLLGGYDAGFIQLAVGTCDRVEVDTQVKRQAAHGGELVAGFKIATQYALANVLLNLYVNGDSGAKIKFKIHKIVSLYLCIIVSLYQLYIILFGMSRGKKSRSSGSEPVQETHVRYMIPADFEHPVMTRSLATWRVPEKTVKMRESMVYIIIKIDFILLLIIKDLSMFKIFSQKKGQKGQGLVEYALILVLVAVVVIGVLTFLGPQVSDVYAKVATAMGGGVQLDDSYFLIGTEYTQSQCDIWTEEGYFTVWGTGSEGLGCYYPY